MVNSNQFFACRLPTEGIEEIYGSGNPSNFAAGLGHRLGTAHWYRRIEEVSR